MKLIHYESINAITPRMNVEERIREPKESPALINTLLAPEPVAMARSVNPAIVQQQVSSLSTLRRKGIWREQNEWQRAGRERDQVDDSCWHREELAIPLHTPGLSVSLA